MSLFDRIKGNGEGAGAPADSQPPMDFDAGFDSGFDSDFDDSFDSTPPAPSPVPQPGGEESILAGAMRRRAGQGGSRRSFTMPDENEQPAPVQSAAPVPQQSVNPPAAQASSYGAAAEAPRNPAAASVFSAPTASAVPASPATQEIMSVEGSGSSLFGQLRTRLGSVVGARQEDDGIDYYTPPEGYTPGRIRYRTRNHRPVPIWLKTAALAVGMLVLIFGLTALVFFSTMIGRVNYVDSDSHAPVRLTLDESAAMQAQLSEEVTNDITLPTLPVRTDKEIQLILLVGVNNAIGSGDAGECDAIVLVAIDHRHDKIKLVSIARELYAQIPDYHNNMIGEAFFYDSASGNRTLDILRQSIELNLCIKIDSIVSIDYDALQIIVNKLGGINMTVTNEEALYMSTHPRYGSFPRYNAGGLYTMTGAEMLGYLRMLYVGDDTDAQRVVRLRSVLGTLYEMVGATPAIDRTAAIYSVLPYVTTDMSRSDVLKIVTGAGRLADYELTGYSLPVSGSWGYDNADINGDITRVVVANYSFNAEYLQKFIYDDDLTYTYGNSTSGVNIPYISEAAKAAAEAEETE